MKTYQYSYWVEDDCICYASELFKVTTDDAAIKIASAMVGNRLTSLRCISENRSVNIDYLSEDEVDSELSEQEELDQIAREEYFKEISDIPYENVIKKMCIDIVNKVRNKYYNNNTMTLDAICNEIIKEIEET
jgi:hypothetical protein